MPTSHPLVPAPPDPDAGGRWSRRRLVGPLVALLVVAAAGCGSGTGSGASSGSGSGSGSAGSDGFCRSVEEYVTAMDAGDLKGMADALEGSTSDLPESVRRDVEAYIDTLRAAPPNREPEPDGIENDASERRFRTYATEACGSDALPATTAVSAPAEATTSQPTTTQVGDRQPTTTVTPGNAANTPGDGPDRSGGDGDDGESYPDGPDGG